MTFPLDRLRALAEAGPVARVVVAATQGSVPREVGASMLVSVRGVEGTIGGGALEHESLARARAALGNGRDRLDRMPLGPALGQCCGGAVSVLIEIWTADRLSMIDGDVVARPLPGQGGEMPLDVRRVLARDRNGMRALAPAMIGGWMVEPVSRPARDIWLWGAGHVGRAIAEVLAPLPNLAVTWIDVAPDRFPARVPDGVKTLAASDPADLVALAPPTAEHLVLTFSHALDLELCHRILGRPFGALGLIGSDTKRARFRSRLGALGHCAAQIDRMQCPIGDPSLGKHPQAIALGVATELLRYGRKGTLHMIGRQA